MKPVSARLAAHGPSVGTLRKIPGGPLTSGGWRSWRAAPVGNDCGSQRETLKHGPRHLHQVRRNRRAGPQWQAVAGDRRRFLGFGAFLVDGSAGLQFFNQGGGAAEAEGGRGKPATRFWERGAAGPESRLHQQKGGLG